MLALCKPHGDGQELDIGALCVAHADDGGRLELPVLRPVFVCACSSIDVRVEQVAVCRGGGAALPGLLDRGEQDGGLRSAATPGVRPVDIVDRPALFQPKDNRLDGHPRIRLGVHIEWRTHDAVKRGVDSAANADVCPSRNAQPHGRGDVKEGGDDEGAGGIAQSEVAPVFKSALDIHLDAYVKAQVDARAEIKADQEGHERNGLECDAGIEGQQQAEA